MKIELFTFFPSDFYVPDWTTHTGKDVFVSKFCSEKAHSFIIDKVNAVKL